MTSPATPLDRWNAWLPRLYLPLVLLVCAAYAWRPLGGGDDFWAHIAIGRWMVQHLELPRNTLFLWTANQPWVAHSWLSELILYGLMRVGGTTGGPYLALALTVVLCTLPWLWLWRWWARQNRINSLIPLVFVLAIWCSSPRYHARPELVTTVFLCLLYLFLVNTREDPRDFWKKSAWVLGMFALWTNMHGAVIYGILVLLITAVCDRIQYRAASRPLLALCAAAVAVIFVFNPRHLDLLQVWKPVGSFVFQNIDEWKPFWKWPAMDLSVVIGEFILWGLALVLWRLDPKRRWAALGWLVMMGLAFLKARRNLWVTALTSMLVIVRHGEKLDTELLFTKWRAWSSRFTGEPVGGAVPPGLRAVMRGCTVFILIIGVAQATPRDWLPVRAVSLRLPTKMAAYVASRTYGRIFNDYEDSAYLEWAFDDRRKLYIDLNNAYPGALLAEYFAILNNDGHQRAHLLRQRGVEVVALRPRTNSESDGGLRSLAKYLNASPLWEQVYGARSGKTDGTVWVRTEVVASGPVSHS